MSPHAKALVRSSDTEFDQRLRAAGGQILLVPDAPYYRSEPTIRSFCGHNLDDGREAIGPLARAGARLSSRHYVPLAFVLTEMTSTLAGIVWPRAGAFAAALIVTYLLARVVAGIQIAIRDRRPSLIAGLSVAFAARHISYGLRSLRAMHMLLPSASPQK